MHSPATVIGAREQGRQEEAQGIVEPGEGAQGESKLGDGTGASSFLLPSSATADSHAYKDPACLPRGSPDMSPCKA